METTNLAQPVQEEKTVSLFRRHVFGFLAVCLPVIYIMLLIISNPRDLLPEQYSFAALVGLFVPFGFYTTIMTMGIGLVLYIPLVVFADRVLNRRYPILRVRVFASLLIFFLITLIVDLIIFKNPLSIIALLSGVKMGPF